MGDHEFEFPDREAGELVIELADGHCWPFPAPVDLPFGEERRREEALACREDRFGAEYLPLLEAIREAENRDEQLLGELALAIHLFCLRHDLAAAVVQRLFHFAPGSEELRASQADFHDLARLHLRALSRGEVEPSRRSSPPVPGGRSLLARILGWPLVPATPSLSQSQP